MCPGTQANADTHCTWLKICIKYSLLSRRHSSVCVTQVTCHPSKETAVTRLVLCRAATARHAPNQTYLAVTAPGRCYLSGECNCKSSGHSISVPTVGHTKDAKPHSTSPNTDALEAQSTPLSEFATKNQQISAQMITSGFAIHQHVLHRYPVNAVCYSCHVTCKMQTGKAA
jgi:hypothetical protein